MNASYTRLFADRFRDGIHIGAQGSTDNEWFHFSAGPFVGDDGVATVRQGVLYRVTCAECIP